MSLAALVCQKVQIEEQQDKPDKHQTANSKQETGLGVEEKLSSRLKAGPSGYFETFSGVSACEGF